MLEDEFEDEESDQVLDQVLDEIGLDLNASVLSPHTHHIVRTRPCTNGSLAWVHPAVAAIDQEPSGRVSGTSVCARGCGSRSRDEEAPRRELAERTPSPSCLQSPT
jgi:hypothetical protein